MKYLGVNLTNHVQELHVKNNKTQMKEIKKDLKKWRHSIFLN